MLTPEDPGYELVIGLVAPVGVDLERVQILLAEQAKGFGYVTKVVHVAGLLGSTRLEPFRLELVNEPEDKRLESYMDAGNRVRELTEQNDILALYAASQINDDRDRAEPNQSRRPAHRTIHLLRSLKTEDEVLTLRSIYGSGFFLIGASSSRDDRLKYLMERKNIRDQAVANQLIERDESEGLRWGQNTSKTFQLADAFITSDGNDDTTRGEIKRISGLLFGNPYETPTKHEHAMFMAYAASLRSGSLARQVGAAILSQDEELISVGCNDVPRFGGGLYWPGENDHRDHALGYDSNDVEKRAVLVDAVKRIRSGSRKQSDESIVNAVLPKMKGARVLDITEFGRDVHAEMEALLACARSGVTPRNGTLYTTTFPCHNCTRHIVAAGISRVVYVEPYAKSKGLELHSDSVELGDLDKVTSTKVVFAPFVGVGPRRYMDLFSLSLGSGRPIRRKKDGQTIPHKEWTNKGPRIQMRPVSYLEREHLAVTELEEAIKMVEHRRGSDVSEGTE